MRDSESKVEVVQNIVSEVDRTKTCFVIMPISDANGYEAGHFKRVYDFIIKPACIKSGFDPLRADDVKGTNMIVVDILQRIISSDMAICDLSARNPNVLYELGIRQSFDLPVTLLKDDITERIFDIQGFRDVFYSSKLRYDEVGKAIDDLAVSLKETYENKGKEVNSIVELLGTSKATIKNPITISPDTEVILSAISELQLRIRNLERVNQESFNENTLFSSKRTERFTTLISGQVVRIGDNVNHFIFGPGKVYNIIKDIDGDSIQVQYKEDSKVIPVSDPLLSKIKR